MPNGWSGIRCRSVFGLFFAPTAPHLKLVRRGLDNGYTAPYEPSEIHIPGHRSHANPGEKAAETAITHLI